MNKKGKKDKKNRKNRKNRKNININIFLNKLNKTRKQIGGSKINYPYVFYFLPAEKYNLSNHFKQYVMERTEACFPGFGRTAENLAPTQLLIILIKYNIFAKINENPNILELDSSIRHEILGHCIIDARKNPRTNSVLYAIYSLCLHKTKQGYGSVMVNLFLNAIKNLDKQKPAGLTPSNIWIAIRLNDKKFYKLLHLYTSLGFKIPQIGSLDPWGSQLPYSYLSLKRSVDLFIDSENDTIIFFNSAVDIRNQFISLLRNPNYVYEYIFKLDKNTILNLRLYPFLDINKNIVLFPEAIEQQRFKQSEWAGSLVNIHSELLKDNTTIYTVSHELTFNGSIDVKEVSGEPGIYSIDIPQSEIVYHSHPLYNYLERKSLLSSPSIDDYISFIGEAIQGNQKCSIVVTIEGLYIISLRKEFINHIHSLTQSQLNTGLRILADRDAANSKYSKYDWTKNERLAELTYYEWGQWRTTPPTEHQVERAIEEYKNIINDIPEREVDVQIIQWKDLTKNTRIKIHYKHNIKESIGILQSLSQNIEHIDPIIN